MLYANLVSTKLRGNWFCFHNHNLQVASFPGFAIGDIDKLSGHCGSEFTQTRTHLYKYDCLRADIHTSLYPNRDEGFHAFHLMGSKSTL